MIGQRPAHLWLAISLVLFLALALRLVGLSFGLPAVYNPDEVAIMNRAIGLWPNRFNPQNFLYPSLYFYVLFVWEGLWFLAGRASGLFGSLADFERAFFVDPSSIYLAGRLLSVVCGVLTVGVTWRLGERLFGRIAGMAGAVLLALAPLAVRDAHYVKHDVPVTLLIALVCLLVAHTLEAGRSRGRRWWIAAGALAGLAISTHYYAVFVMVPVLALAWAPDEAFETARERLTRLAIIGLSSALAFVLTSPFLLLNLGTALRDITANREIVMDRATSSGGAFASLWYYVAWLFGDAFGVAASALAVLGFVVVLRAGRRRVALVLGFPVLFLLFLGNTVPASRYLNPVLPFMAVSAGAAVSWLLSGPTPARIIGVLACASAVIMSAAASVKADLFFRQTDTRTLAAEWIEREVPQGASLLIQPYSVPLRPSRPALEEALTTHLGDVSRASIRFQRQLALAPYPTPSYRTIYLGTGGLDVDKIYVDPAAFDHEAGVGPLQRMQVTYVVMKRYNVADPAMAPLDRALQRDGRLLVTFSPYRTGLDAGDRDAVPPFLHNTDVRIEQTLDRPGPIIEIWRIG